VTSIPTETHTPGLMAEARRAFEGALGVSGDDLYVSVPVPVVHEGTPAAAFFASRLTSTVEDDRISAPLATAVLSWPDGRQLALRTEQAAAAEPVSLRTRWFQGAMDEEARRGLATQMQRLAGLLELVHARYTANPQRPPMDDGTRYIEQLEDVVAGPARAHYERLNPDFFAWVVRGR
jgi:hypothetical protein